MYENSSEITIRNKTYPLLFNVAALKEVGTRYGGIEELGKKLQEDYGKAISEYSWILAMLIAQGIALRNFEEGTNDKAPTPEQIELLMSPKDLFGQQKIIIAVIKDGMSIGSEPSETEEVDEVLEEILASKNGAGAEG